MTPAVTSFKGLDLKVKLPANLFLSNYPATIQNIQIDFSDGLGFRLVPYDQLINVSYTVANTYTWQYKITLTNGQTLLSHSKVVIEAGLDELTSTAGSSTARVNPSARTSITGYEKVPITATTAYNGYGSATLYIRYANNGTTIRKPLIVAEGFDTGVILQPENEGGDNNINNFLTGVIKSQSSLLGELNSYDIIYVDWNVGVDFIQKNAYVLEEVIKYVNTKKAQAGSTTANVIIGQSMGGLIARYALRDIELNRNFNHDTKLYISHDAPHLGANTPLSVQYSARHLRNLYISTPIPLIAGEVIMPMIFNFAEGFSNTINAYGGNTTVDAPITPLRAFSLADVPAARQMQYTWVSNTGGISNTIHDAWQQELSNLGYPQGYVGKPIRNIAIANGSECGITQVDNGNIMSYIKDAGRDTFLSNYIGIMDGVYGTLLNRPDIAIIGSLFPGKSYWEIDFQSKYMTTLNQSKNIYHGSIKYKKKVFWFIPISMAVTNMDVNQPTGILPYDIYGGGIQKTNNKQLPLDNIVSNGFGFIPTASALDIGKGTTVINDTEYRKSFVGAIPPTAPTNSPFQNFVSNFDANNPSNNNSTHISFNLRNGNWLTAELIANSNSSASPEYANCSYMCSDVQIAGNSVLCNSGSYSVPSGGGYSWSITEGANLVTLSGNGTNTVVINPSSASASGKVTLSVYLGNKICDYKTLTKSILVGKPSIEIKLTSDSNYATIDLVSANNVDITQQGITSTTWTKIASTNSGNGGGSGFSGFGNGPNFNWTITLVITATNACGTTSITRVVTCAPPTPCNNTYSLVAKSSNGYVANKIIDPCAGATSLQKTSLQTTNVSDKEITSAKLYDLEGSEIRNYKTNDYFTEGIKKGIYILKVEIKEVMLTKKIIVN
jgi:hypothetical protein